MKWLFYLNGAIEAGAGLTLLLYPGMVNWIPGLVYPDDGSILLIKLYGWAAFCVGVLSFLIARAADQPGVLKLGLIFFTLFHLGLGALLLAFSLDPRAGYFHLLLGIIFGVVLGRFSRDSRSTMPETP